MRFLFFNLAVLVAQATAAQPFDVSKAHLRMYGDSLTLNYPTILTNMNHWKGLASFKNSAGGGTIFFHQTNVYFLEEASLPTVGNGTNVIIALNPGAVDQIGMNSMGGIDNYITAYLEFCGHLKGRGYIVVVRSMMPCLSYYDDRIFKFNNAIVNAVDVIDYVPDFFRRLPDNTNTNLWDADLVHPRAYVVMAHEWDRTVWHGHRPMPYYGEQIGNAFQFRNSYGGLELQVMSGRGLVFLDNSGSDNDIRIYLEQNNLVFNSWGRSTFRVGESEKFNMDQSGVSAPSITLTATGDSSTPHGVIFADNGGTMNDVYIGRNNGSSVGIVIKSGASSTSQGFVDFMLGDTSYMTLDQNLGNPRLILNVPIVNP